MIRAKKYGWVNVQGVWFFIEDEPYPLPPFCPIERPSNILCCPHRTPLEEEPLPHIKPKIYFTYRAVEFDSKYDVCNSEVKYMGRQTLPLIKSMMEQTNYIPIIVREVGLKYGFHQFYNNLNVLLMMLGRSVVLEIRDPYLPIPPSATELNSRNMKNLALKYKRKEKYNAELD